MSKTSSAVKRRYNKKAYDVISTSVPKGTKDLFKAACEQDGESMNGVINKWIKSYLESKEGE